MISIQLTSCPACDGKVSTAASACPHCGHPINAKEPRPGDFFGQVAKWVPLACGVILSLHGIDVDLEPPA
jgi:predicted amidophosphoribosyltransferase